MVWSESAISRAETWYLASVSSMSSTSVISDLGRGRKETEWVGVPRAETLGEETGPPTEVEDDGCSLSIPTLPHSQPPPRRIRDPIPCRVGLQVPRMGEPVAAGLPQGR